MHVFTSTQPGALAMRTMSWRKMKTSLPFVFEVVLALSLLPTVQSQPQTAVFMPEFSYSPQGSFMEANRGDHLTFTADDQASRTTRSDEDEELGWDSWGAWSDCSRSCGGGASYQLRRCLNGGNCEGKNIRYQTCSNLDCPAGSGDFRAQQCSAHNDVRHQGSTHEWAPAPYDPAAPCALRCLATGGRHLLVELAPTVLDGTRCRDDALDMCISGVCQEVGCDHQLGGAREDHCGVCGGHGSTCRPVRGQVLPHVSPEEPVKVVLEVPTGSRFLRVNAKGPDLIVIEAVSLQGQREEASLASTGQYVVGNTSLDFQKGAHRQTLRSHGPLNADYIIKIQYGGSRDTAFQFFYYQPIRYQWRETDFFPCSVTCGGGYQLNSAECTDVLNNRTMPEHQCNHYPENSKPTPKLRECNVEPCLEIDGFKEVMPYDHFQPLPRWEQGPCTRCSVSCGDGGGWQECSVACVVDDGAGGGRSAPAEEWNCAHSPRPATRQACNSFPCPQWVAMEWSQCTVTCGRGLRYRVVLCIDHRGQHIGDCKPTLKPQVKEDCLVPITCHKPRESVPVEAKVPWIKQAQELEEHRMATENPTYIPGPWSPCSSTCGPGRQTRELKCKVLLTFTKTEVELPEEECGEDRPRSQRPCGMGPCTGGPGFSSGPLEPGGPLLDGAGLYHWDYRGFTVCSATCASGMQTAVVKCVSRRTGEEVDNALCDHSGAFPPRMVRTCSPGPCPPRWEPSPWKPCSATCGVGIRTRAVQCARRLSSGPLGIEAVPEDECREFKPAVLQPCNQVACPPTWETGPWQQCSQSCGGGVQAREVFCRQLLSTGAYQRVEGGACKGAAPEAQRACASVNCSPYWAGGEWDKCSVSCGLGIQRRRSLCRRLTSRGRQVDMAPGVCSGLSSPPLLRPCHLVACPKHKKMATAVPKIRPTARTYNSGVKRCPGFSPRHHTYVQVRPAKRLQLHIGGHAFLLPGTSVVIRCPVRGFPKSYLHWRKDGGPLPSSTRLAVTKAGSLRIRSLEAGDIGEYKCSAGPASDIFTLQLVGRDNRLIDRPPVGERLSGGWDDMIPSCFSHRSWLDLFLTEYFKVSLLPPGVQEVELQPQLKERLLKVILQVDRGVLRQEQASPIISSLLAQMFHSEEAGWVEGRLPTWPGRADESVARPEISRQVQGSGLTLHTNVNVSIGHTAFLTNATRSLTVCCPADGVPQPTISWTKDGAPLQITDRDGKDGILLLLNAIFAMRIKYDYIRVSWDEIGLHILQPTATDQGRYRCMARNVHGSDSAVSEVMVSEPPSITASRRNVSDRGQATGGKERKAVVGDRVSLQSGDSLTLDCPVSGVPPPRVTWQVVGGSLDTAAVPRPSGTLWLHNVSVKSQGMYVCTASSPLGHHSASSLLQVHGQHAGGVGRDPSVTQDMNRRKVLIASRSGTSAIVRPGDSLRIVCPVVPEHRMPVDWDYQNQTLRGQAQAQTQTQIQGLQYRMLARGRVLEVGTLQDRFWGRYRCRTFLSSTRQRLSAWVYVRTERFTWHLGDWGACSASCGNRGQRTRTVRCLGPEGRDVEPVLCHLQPRPLPAPGACSTQHCPPSWKASAWSPCSASCGRGWRQRRVSCQMLEASGELWTLAEHECDHSARPAQRQQCTSHDCPAGGSSNTSASAAGPHATVQMRCYHANSATHQRCIQTAT